MSDEKGEKCVLGRLGSAGLMLGLDELRRFSQSQWLCAAVRAGGTPQSMLWAAEHRAAGRRELFEEHFSPLQLTQRVSGWKNVTERFIYFRVLHMKAIPNVERLKGVEPFVSLFTNFVSLPGPL